MSNYDPVSYEEWIEAIKGPGLFCNVCEAVAPEYVFYMNEPMPLCLHEPDCWVRVIDRYRAALERIAGLDKEEYFDDFKSAVEVVSRYAREALAADDSGAK